MGAARTRVDARLSLAIETDHGYLPGFWTMFDALTSLYEGFVARSYAGQVQALVLLDRYDSWLSRPLAQVGAAHAAALMANAAEARRHMAALSPEMRAAPRIRSRVDHVEALIISKEDGLTAGALAAVAAGDQAAEDGHLLWAVEAWHLAVRLGRADLVSDQLSEAAADRPGTVASLYSSHAGALMEEDPVALDTVMRTFNRRGFWASPGIVEGCLLMIVVSDSPALLCRRFGSRASGAIWVAGFHAAWSCWAPFARSARICS